MDFKKVFNTLFSYTPNDEYNFYLPDITKDSQNQTTNESNKKTSIYPSLNVNIDYMKTMYNILINSDIILREFTINARGKQYNAFIIYIDGMVDSEIMDKFIIKPLMIRDNNNLFDGSQNKIISEAITNNITVRKIKKFDLPNYLMGCLIPQNAIKELSNFEDVANGINSRKLCFICRYFKYSI